MKSGKHSSRPGIVQILFFVVALFFCIQSTSAQPVLNFKRAVLNWPSVEIFYSVTCNGKPVYITDKQFIRLREDQKDIGQFSIECPDTINACPMSVALVMDASGSMAGAGNAGAKAAGNAFIDLMDGVKDEGCVLWFNTAVTVALGMTTSKNMLKTALNSLPAGGGTAIWDGIYRGIQEVLNNGSNTCRTVIALTDGMNNAGTHTPAEIIGLAQKNRIRVFTIGLGGVFDKADLQKIAEQTGGTYNETPTPTNLVSIYQEIHGIISKGFEECLITYNPICMDGSTRSVELTIENYCGGNATKSKTITVPLDTTTFMPVTIQLGNVSGKGNSEIIVPVELMTTISPAQNFGPAIFTVYYDQSCVQFKGFSIPSNSLLAGVQYFVSPVPSGVMIQLLASKEISGKGLLGELIFTARDLSNSMTCPVTFGNWTFSKGCLRPDLKDGSVEVNPRTAVIASCVVSAPQSLTWSTKQKDYIENPFTVEMNIVNGGDKDIENIRFQFMYDKSIFYVVSPPNDIIPGSPANLPPGQTSTGVWTVVAKPRTRSDSIPVCFFARTDNTPECRKCVNIFIPQAGPVLECSLSAPQITVDVQQNKYTPMPFAVTLNVNNSGGATTDTVYATLVLPSGDLALAGADAPGKYTKQINPSILNPGGQGSATWTLSHPVTQTAKYYDVGVWVKTTNTDSSYCTVRITIPSITSPSLTTQCSVPDSLSFNNNLGTFIPNPFSVSVSCMNVGGVAAYNTRATLILPADFELANPTDSLTKYFSPQTIDPYSGGPQFQVAWSVRYLNIPKSTILPQFTFIVNAEDPFGNPVDSVAKTCSILIRGVSPQWTKLCPVAPNDIPDSLGVNPSATGVTPNPFSIVWKISNNGWPDVRIKTVNLIHTLDGITLDPTTPANILLDTLLKRNDILSITHIFHVDNRPYRRHARFEFHVTDEEGRTDTCVSYIWIDAVGAKIFCSIVPKELIVRYDPDFKVYVPDRWVITEDLIAGGMPLTNVRATISWSDTSGLNLIEFDPTYPDNSNPKVKLFLQALDTARFEWGFRLKNENTSAGLQTVVFRVAYVSDELPVPQQECEATVHIEKIILNTDQTARPYKYSLSQNHPNPFNPSTVIVYEIPEATFARLVVYDALGREIRTLVNERTMPGQYRLTFDAANLPSGVYIYRLQTANYSQTRCMILAK